MAERDPAYRVSGAKQLPILDEVRIAAPCDVSWDAMQGNGRVRHCPSCDKQVFNVSAMSRADAEVLLRERTEGLCVRLYQRADGTILTNDCPVGVRKRFTARALLSLAAGTFVGACVFLGLGSLGRRRAPQRSDAPAATYRSHGRPESMTTAGMLALQNDARLREELASLPRPPEAPPTHRPVRPGGQHMMGAVCPLPGDRRF